MEDNDSKELKALLNFDALHEAEKVTGKSYKEDGGTESLGFLWHIENSQKRKALLTKLGDSTFSNTEEDYLNIVKSIGFESLLVEPFINRDGIEERYHIMWNKERSILLSFDTHTWGDDGSWAKAGKDVPPPNVNGGKIYYNWSPNPDCKNHCTSSGGYVGNGDSNKSYSVYFNSDFTPHILPDELRVIEPKLDWDDYDGYIKAFDEWCDIVTDYVKENQLVKVWSGDHSCQEAIKFNISELEKNGAFLKQWVEPPFMWLLHYMDSKDDGYDYKAITNERLKQLPKEVLEAMNIKF